MVSEMCIRDRLVDQIRGQHDRPDAGAGSILFACTGLTTIGLAADVTQRTGLPVVDAVLAAGAVAAYPSLLPPTIRPREDQGAS